MLGATSRGSRLHYHYHSVRTQSRIAAQSCQIAMFAAHYGSEPPIRIHTISGEERPRRDRKLDY